MHTISPLSLSEPIEGETLVKTTGTRFHYCGVKLAPGSVVEPGNWGRMINLYPHNADANNAWRFAIELIFERERERNYPALPSRLTSCFVFESAPAAQVAGPRLNSYWNVLYEVELINSDLPIHRADFDLVTACLNPDGVQFSNKVTAAANSYWSGVIRGTPELLTASPLRVIRAVS